MTAEVLREWVNNKDRDLRQGVKDSGNEFVGTRVGLEEESMFNRYFEHT